LIKKYSKNQDSLLFFTPYFFALIKKVTKKSSLESSAVFLVLNH
jgi:hypothetical protein